MTLYGTSAVTNPDITVAVTLPSALGESPMWHPREQVLYYCDIPGRCVNRYDPATGELSHWPFDSEVASLAPMLGGGLLLAARDGLWRFDVATGKRTALAPPPYDPRTERFNDGKCDPQGRFWVGTIYEPRDPPNAALYRYADGKLDKMADKITVSNGLAWSPDARTMYWADTQAHAVYALDFDVSDGSVSKRRVFAQFPVKAPDQPLTIYGAAPTAPRSMPKAATGWRCSKALACCASRPTARPRGKSRCRCAARPCPASAVQT